MYSIYSSLQLYNKAMFAIPGQTAGLNWLALLEGTHGSPIKESTSFQVMARAVLEGGGGSSFKVSPPP